MALNCKSSCRKIAGHLEENILCCFPKRLASHNASGEVDNYFQKAVDCTFQSSYVEVDPRDIEKLSSALYTGDSENVPPGARAEKTAFKRLLSRLQFRGRKPRCSRMPWFQRIHSRLSRRGHRTRSTCKRKELTTSLEFSLAGGDIDAVDYGKTGLNILQSDEEKMRMVLSDDDIGITDHMAIDLDMIQLVQEEEMRMRQILIEDYMSSEDITSMDDSMKAAKTDELFHLLSKADQHAIRHHSYILVQDILSQL